MRPSHQGILGTASYALLALLSPYTASAQPVGLFHSPEAWEVPGTNHSSVLENQCGLVTELQLLTSRHTTGVMAVFKGTTPSPKTLRPREARILFEDGREILNVSGAPGDLKIKQDEFTSVFMRLPEKEMLSGQESIKFEFPVFQSADDSQPCVIRAIFRSIPGVEANPTDYLTHTRMELVLGIGAPVLRSEPIRSWGGGGPSLAFDIYFYGLRNGFVAGGGIDSFGIGSTAFSGITPGRSDSVKVQNAFAYAGYSRRWLPTRELRPSYDIGLGAYSPGYSLDGANYLQDSMPALIQRLNLDLLCSRVYLPPQGGMDLSLGLSVQHLWIARQAVDGIPFGGHSLGLLARLKVGL